MNAVKRSLFRKLIDRVAINRVYLRIEASRRIGPLGLNVDGYVSSVFITSVFLFLKIILGL